MDSLPEGNRVGRPDMARSMAEIQEQMTVSTFRRWMIDANAGKEIVCKGKNVELKDAFLLAFSFEKARKEDHKQVITAVEGVRGVVDKIDGKLDTMLAKVSGNSSSASSASSAASASSALVVGGTQDLPAQVKESAEVEESVTEKEKPAAPPSAEAAVPAEAVVPAEAASASSASSAEAAVPQMVEAAVVETAVSQIVEAAVDPNQEDSVGIQSDEQLIEAVKAKHDKETSALIEKHKAESAELVREYTEAEEKVKELFCQIRHYRVQQGKITERRKDAFMSMERGKDKVSQVFEEEVSAIKKRRTQPIG